MYPALELLQEIGRVTIAGSRLEIQMGQLWWQLDKGGVDELEARKESLTKQAKEVRRLASVCLCGELLSLVRLAVADALAAAEQRNKVVHQDWVLRGPDATRSVADLPLFESDSELRKYIEDWEREAKSSPDWLRLPGRSLELLPGNTPDELREVERSLAAAADRVGGLVFAVASARSIGPAAGWTAAIPQEQTEPPPGWLSL